MSVSPRVNVPNDPAQRDRDVEHKLQLYGIYTAFSNGKLPSNAQIDVALNSFINHEKLRNPNQQLSEEGKVILGDFRVVVEEAKRLLLTKNYDQALQEFIWHATQLGQKGTAMDTSGAPIDKDTAKSHVQEGVAGLKTLGQLILSNGQFRKLINDAVILLRSVAGDTAAKTASRLNPTQEELQQIDEPAPDHQWHDTPDFSRDNIKHQVRDKIDRNKPLSRKDLRDTAGNATQAADPAGSRNPRDTAQRAANDQRQSTQSGVDAGAGLRTAVNDVSQRVGQNLPEEHKQRGREYRDRTKRYMKKQMPQERREQTIWRLKKMVVEIQSHEDYAEAINTLLNLAETYNGHTKHYINESAERSQGVRNDTHLRSAQSHLKVLIERFADNTSTDDLMEAVNDLYRDADKDPELKAWFRNLNTYIRKCLQETGYIIQPASTNEYNQIYDRGNFLLRDRYRDHTDRLVNEATFLMEQFSNDPLNNRFADSLQHLSEELGNDENGKPTFKRHLLKDITSVIIPDLFESIRYIPVPRIEYSDHMFDAIIENLVLEGDNLMPNILDIGNDSNFHFSRKNTKSSRKQSIVVAASQIQCDLRDISYYVRRKQGFPAITDTGVADIFMGGEGFGFHLHLSTPSRTDRARFFKVESVKVHIKNLRIKLKQSQHKMLFGIFKTLLLRILKPVIIKILEQQIRRSFARFDAFCYRIHAQQELVKKSLQDSPDSEEPPNVYSRYYQAFQKELSAHKQRAERKAAGAPEKTAKFVITPEDSMFKEIKLPGGISTRTAHYREQARTGDHWHNDVFSLGSARPTQDLPKPEPVTRKSPHAHRRAVRERENSEATVDSGFQQGPYFAEDNQPGVKDRHGDGNYGANEYGGNEYGANGYGTKNYGAKNYGAVGNGNPVTLNQGVRVPPGAYTEGGYGTPGVGVHPGAYTEGYETANPHAV